MKINFDTEKQLGGDLYITIISIRNYLRNFMYKEKGLLQRSKLKNTKGI